MTSNAIMHHEQIVLPSPNRRVVLLVLAIAVIVMLLLALRSKSLSPEFLNIEAMQVYGELNWVDREQLNKAVQPYLDSNFFSADLNGIKQTVEALPWVASASVRREWPNQLQITISEHQPVARWKDGALINDKGELFEPAEIPDQMAKALVQLQGPENTYQELFAIYQELRPLFETTEFVQQESSTFAKKESTTGPLIEGLIISKVYMNQRRALGIELQSGIHVIFGRMNASMDLYSAATRFLKAFTSNLKEQAGQIAVVDLRYTNGFAVEWKNSSNTQH
jgi:cell division protein FtsQ